MGRAPGGVRAPGGMGRQSLRSTHLLRVATAISLPWGAACGADGETDRNTRCDAPTVPAAAACPGIEDAGSDDDAGRDGVVHELADAGRDAEVPACDDPASTLTLGPVLGAVSDTGIKVWVRSGDAQPIGVRFWPSQRAQDARETWGPGASADDDFSSVMSLDGLLPDTDYEYGITTRDGACLTAGTFRTLPRADSPARIRFVTAGDVLDADVPGFRDIAATGANFVIMVGDNVYASGSGETIDAYRARYERVWGGPDFRALFSRIPTFMMWDDHELVDNYWDGKNDEVYAFARRLFDTYQGSHNPDPVHDGEIYYAFHAGQVGFFVLDIRSHRSRNADPDGPDKTMLGAKQKAALLDWLAQDPSRVHVIVSPVLMHRSTSSTGQDSWQYFATERGEILDAIVGAGTANVFVISGDQHWSAVLRMDRGADPYSVYEFQATPLDFVLRGAPSHIDETVIGLDNKHRTFGVFDIDTSADPPIIDYTLCAVGDPCTPHEETRPPSGKTSTVPYSVSFVGGDRGLRLASDL